MPKKMKDYQIFKCPFCSCEFYDSTAKKGKKVGNPLIKCPQCHNKLYRKNILEPALTSGYKHFDIKFSSLYGNLRIGLILMYLVFLVFILITRDFALTMCFVAAAVVLFVLYQAVRMIHRNEYLKSEQYYYEIEQSMNRLSDPKYADMITEVQDIDEESVYYYELDQEE